jgi:hypothetical protein
MRRASDQGACQDGDEACRWRRLERGVEGVKKRLDQEDTEIASDIQLCAKRGGVGCRVSDLGATFSSLDSYVETAAKPEAKCSFSGSAPGVEPVSAGSHPGCFRIRSSSGPCF